MANPEIVARWRVLYARVDEIDPGYLLHWESLCIGWCLANGLTVDEAYAFYQEMIPLELF